MNSQTSLNEQRITLRISLWTALIAIHSVFLTAAFAVVFATKSPANLITTLIAYISLAGIVLTLFCLASALGQNLELTSPGTSQAARWWAEHRPTIWTIVEVCSVLAFLGCGVILLVAVVKGSG